MFIIHVNNKTHTKNQQRKIICIKQISTYFVNPRPALTMSDKTHSIYLLINLCYGSLSSVLFYLFQFLLYDYILKKIYINLKLYHPITS